MSGVLGRNKKPLSAVTVIANSAPLAAKAETPISDFSFTGDTPSWLGSGEANPFLNEGKLSKQKNISPKKEDAIGSQLKKWKTCLQVNEEELQKILSEPLPVVGILDSLCKSDCKTPDGDLYAPANIINLRHVSDNERRQFVGENLCIPWPKVDALVGDFDVDIIEQLAKIAVYINRFNAGKSNGERGIRPIYNRPDWVFHYEELAKEIPEERMLREKLEEIREVLRFRVTRKKEQEKRMADIKLERERRDSQINSARK